MAFILVLIQEWYLHKALSINKLFYVKKTTF